MIKIRGNNPILTPKANIFLHVSSTSTPISFKPSQQGFILQMIKIRGNNPILTPKANIFLHVSSTSTPISFKPSQQGFILQDDQNKG